MKRLFCRHAVPIGLLLVCLTQLSFSSGSGRPDALHKFHVATTRLGIEGNVIIAQIRFFKDDLTDGLRAFSGERDLSLRSSPRLDSLFLAYSGSHFVLSASGAVLPARVIGSGEEMEGKEVIWWYAVQFDSEKEPDRIVVENSLLTEVFDDQKNILKVQKFPSERSSSYFFDGDETRAEITL
jgi:hypothetical protein